MSFLMRKVAHCDICGHEWLTNKVPTHCAKCKSRKWNSNDAPVYSREAFERFSKLPKEKQEELLDRAAKMRTAMDVNLGVKLSRTRTVEYEE